MTTTARFWPLDMDQEGQIYDNLNWDLPGYRRGAKKPLRRSRASRRPPHRSK